ncbi:MAG: FlgO family outer membrane protein [Glaciecola sp.]|jgi:TolB-like protein|nr:FlgO family outer membrane protein [Glaciecola sp.]MDG1815123.1 FlgO family outer membrane protein [Glaciecola sp.]MDG2099372.1 FlgO family outer membrane protein [Glaciecola sp.]
MPKKLLIFIIVSISVVTLSGCVLTQGPSIPVGRYADDAPLSSDTDAPEKYPADIHMDAEDPLAEAHTIAEVDVLADLPVAAKKPDALLYTINDYVRNLTQDLVANMENITPQTPLGVTHFAWLDSDLNQSNVMALQMAEGFKHEFHQYRIPVVDFKSTGFIRVTSQGDFYLSRDHEDLNIDVPMDYILTGTFALHHGGVLINARVIDVSSKHIVASAQSLIPEHIANAVMGSYENVIGEHLDLLGLSSQN